MGINAFWFLWILAFLLVSIVGLILQKRKQAFRYYGITSRLALLALLVWSLQVLINSEEEYRPPFGYSSIRVKVSVSCFNILLSQ